MSPTWTLIAVFAVMLALLPAANAQPPIQYIYDDLGRLVGVVDPAADTAVYSYDAVGNLLSIARFAFSTVSIIAFSPGSGPVGATVTISGTGFSTTPSQNAVTFNGTAATVTTATATRLVTTVPSGATTGTIAVTSPSGSATSSNSFTVTASNGLPTLTSFSPTVGMPGDATTISGTNYETTIANNRVAFNVTRPMYGRISTATTTSLNVTVPVGATSGRISVGTPTGKATSTAAFFVPPPGQGYTAASVGFAGRIEIGGSSVAVTIPSNKIAMVLFDATAGQRLSLGLTSISMWTVGSIYTPDGTMLTSWTGPSLVGYPIHLAPLPMTGTYTVVVRPTPASGSGNVTLTLSEDVTGTTTVGGSALAVSLPRAGHAPDVTGTLTVNGAAQTMTTTVPGQRVVMTFTGTAGQQYTVRGANSTQGCITLFVKRPDNVTPSTGSCAASYSFAVTSPTSGTFTVTVDPSGTNTGSVDVSVTNP